MRIKTTFKGIAMNYKTTEDYKTFGEEVTHKNRTFLSSESLEFLKWFEDVISEKFTLNLNKEQTLFRARRNKQLGIPIAESEMKPRKNLGSSGRANAFNIPVLYLADHKEIAIQECRPELRDEFTVARFEVVRDLKLIDFAGERPSWGSYLGYYRMRGELKDHHEEQCLLKIGGDFSKPLAADGKEINYIPTQVITDYFKSKGYDGVAYQTQFQVADKPGIYRNYALFDLDCANPIGNEILRVSELAFKTEVCSEYKNY